MRVTELKADLTWQSHKDTPREQTAQCVVSFNLDGVNVEVTGTSKAAGPADGAAALNRAITQAFSLFTEKVLT